MADIDWRKEFGTEVKNLYIKSAEVATLPAEGIANGSTAFCVDTSEVYIFYEKEKKWYKQ